MSLSIVTHVRLLFVSCLLLSERKLVFHNTAFGRAVKLRRLEKILLGRVRKISYTSIQFLPQTLYSFPKYDII